MNSGEVVALGNTVVGVQVEDAAIVVLVEGEGVVAGRPTNEWNG